MVAFGIAGLSIVMALCVVAGVWRTSGRRSAVWVAVAILIGMSVQIALAQSGVLNQWARQPAPIMPMVAVCVIITCLFAFSGVGTRLTSLPPAVLVGSQAFRLPLELTMHRAAMEGLMPVQMSYSGSNFDIVTGATAILVALAAAAGKAPRWLIVAWNTLGLVLLINIVTVAIRSTPVFHAYGFDRLNTWIAHAPYVWLPGVLVPCALLGHLLVWRQLSSR
jgi:hypothetical protein